VSSTTRSFDDVAIRYEVQGEGEPTGVLVHGWGFDGRIWEAAVPRLARARRVVTLDLAGHGRSGRERRRPTIASFAEDVRAVVEAVGAPRVVLVGHSMGGDVVVEAARRLPGHVAGVVLVDTLLDVEARMPADQLAAVFAALEADFPAAVGAFFRQWMFTSATDPALVRSIVARAQAMDPEVGLAAIRSALTHDARDALRALAVPVRAVNADRFPTRADVMRRYARDFDYGVVEGTGHYLMLEKPGRFGELLEWAVNEVARAA